MTNIDAAFRRKVDLPYEAAVEKVIAALKEEGFGVLTEIDVQATLKKKLDVDFRKYVILGACNPPLAHRALQTEMEIGLLLPCNVIVYEEDGGSVISIIDPLSMLDFVEGTELTPVADEARVYIDCELYLANQTLLELYGVAVAHDDAEEPLVGLAVINEALEQLADDGAFLLEVASDQDDGLVLTIGNQAGQNILLAVTAWLESTWDTLPEETYT